MRKSKKMAAAAVMAAMMAAMAAACAGKPEETAASAAVAAAAKDGEKDAEKAPEAPGAEEPKAAKSGVSIGKIPVTLKHDVHGNDAKWAEIYAKDKYGASYEVIDPDSDLSKEIAAMETFIGKGVDGIILHPVDENGVDEIIQEARDAGINVMTYNVKAAGKKVPFLGIDEANLAEQMGADMAKKWIELYPDKEISVGLISWTNIAFSFDNRTGPFLKGVKSVVDYLPTDDWGFQNSQGENLTGAAYWEHAGGELELAQTVTADAITKHPDVNIVYGDNVSNGLGCLSAYEAAGRGLAKDGVPLTEIIASTDASSGELMKLADPSSSLKYCLGMQPQTNAYAEIDMMMEIINGELDNDTYVERWTPDVYFNYYKDSLEDMQDWYNTQYLPDTKLDLAGAFGS